MKIESNEDTRKYVNFINIIDNIYLDYFMKKVLC